MDSNIFFPFMLKWNMEEENMDFDKAFKIMSFSMNLNKSHPTINRDIKWLCQVGFFNSVMIIIFSFITYCTIMYDLRDGDMTQACANGILGLLFIISEYKLFVMFYYQDTIVDIIKKINLDYEKSRQFPEYEKSIIQKFIKKGQVMTKVWLTVVMITSGLFLVKSVGMMIYYTIEDRFKVVHLYEMTYPPVIEEIKDTWGVFILLYVMFLFYDYYMAVTFIGFVPLGSVLTLHSCGQLEIARHRVLTLFQKHKTHDEIFEELKDIAKLLQHILSFIDSIKTSFMVFYELTLKATSVIIPVTLFQIIESMKSGDFRVEFVTVFFASTFLSSIPCYYSDMLKEAGNSLNLAIYTCGWERHFEPRNRKLLLLLLVQTSKSMALRTIFLEICLEALTGVFQMAYTIFNLLNAI